MVIDFHTHIFPDKIAAKTISILEKNILDIEGVAHYAFLDGTLSALKNSMRKNGVDYSVVLPIATTVTQSATINNFAHEINGIDNIFSFGSVHPMQENWEQELERIAALGLLGIKLHPEYQGVYVDSKECINVLKKAEKLGLSVVLHTGRDIGIQPPVHCMPDMLKRAVSHLENGGSNIIAAHMGGWRVWDDVLEHLAGSNIMLDTSYSAEMMDNELFLKIADKHGTDKILFGTDSPWQEQGAAIEQIRKLGFGNADLDKIFCENAKKLLKLS